VAKASPNICFKNWPQCFHTACQVLKIVFSATSTVLSGDGIVTVTARPHCCDSVANGSFEVSINIRWTSIHAKFHSLCCCLNASLYNVCCMLASKQNASDT
jgi:hypothetical protein